MWNKKRQKTCRKWRVKILKERFAQEIRCGEKDLQYEGCKGLMLKERAKKN